VRRRKLKYQAKGFFAKRLLELFTELNVNQNEFAAKLGMTQSIVSKYINGEALPGYEALEQIAAALSVEPGTFYETKAPARSRKAA
jgi:transcriptional regulator with XRE-family HTH domain